MDWIKLSSLRKVFFARQNGRHRFQALALLDNIVSLEFHRALGFEPFRDGAVLCNGVWVIKDYSGAGYECVVLARVIYIEREVMYEW